MNPPQVYMCYPSRTLLPPHTIPLGRPSAPAPSIQHHASNLDWQLVSYMIFYMFLVAFKIDSLSWTFDSFNVMCPGEGLFASRELDILLA